jgi:signal transduction histidine kinase
VLAEFRALRATVLRLYEKSGGTDLTDVRRFNEAIDEAMTESMDRFAHQTDRFRDQFIGVIGHDLRTPLGAITSGAAVLAIPEDNPERRLRVAPQIVHSAQRMARMIADLLDFANARLGGSLPLKRQLTNLQPICEEGIMEVRAAYPDAVLQADISGDLRGSWDADRLAQVVSNLLVNAIQHGGGTAVSFTVRPQGDDVTLAVHNGGPPIPQQALSSVFEPLARGSAEGQSHSIGLGLFIARAIVTAHGGDIQVSSSTDAGTTFTVRLPKG